MKHSIITAFLCTFAIQPAFGQFQTPKVILSFNALTQFGQNNRDSVKAALNRLGVPFDTIDRNQAGSDTIDYTPYGILIWASGDPTIDVVPGEPSGQAGLSAKEIGEVEKFLKAGMSDCHKAFVIAGRNVAYEHGSLMPNGFSVDTEFLQSWLHVNFAAKSPDSNIYKGEIIGQQPAYWTYPDAIISDSPNVVKPAITTPAVGPEVNGFAYTYSKYPLTPLDSGAGISFYNESINTIFYAFDWADPHQIAPQDSLENELTSGTTRVLAGALAFVRGHAPQGCTISSVQTENAAQPSLELKAIVPNPAWALTNSFLPCRSIVSSPFAFSISSEELSEPSLNKFQ